MTTISDLRLAAPSQPGRRRGSVLAGTPRVRYAAPVSRNPPPAELWRTLWDLDAASLDVEADAESIIPRVLEHGGLAELEVLVASYGLARIHGFLRDVAHPIVSERTRRFWRAFFRKGAESWSAPPSWRQSSSAPWIG